MNKLLRLLLLSLGGLAAILTVVVIAVLFFVDPNDYRAQINNQVQQTTGRELQIGDIDLSLFPWIGVQLSDVTLGNAEGFEGPFAQLSKVDVKVKLLPLLRKEVEIAQVVLNGLALNLAKNPQGVGNWEDLTAAPETAPAEATPAPTEETTQPPAIAALTIGGLAINDAQVAWDDQQTGARQQLTQLNLHSGPITLGEPFDIDFSVTASSSEPAISGKLDLQTRITLELEQQRYQLSNLRLNIQLDSKQLLPVSPLDIAIRGDLDVDLAQQQLTLQPLQIDTLGVTVKAQARGEQIIDAPRFNAQLETNQIDGRKLLQQLNIPLETADPEVLKAIVLQLQLAASTESFELKNLALQLDQSQLTGNATVENFTQPVIRFTLALDQLDADRYLPPPAPEAAPVATTDTPTTDEPLPIPVEMLRGLDVAGGLSVEKLKLMNLQLADIQLGLKAKQGLVQLAPIQLALYQGRLDGKASLDVQGDQAKFAAAPQLQGVEILPLLKDFMDLDLAEGKATINADLHTQGNTVEALQHALNGTARLALKDGAVKGVNIGYELQKAYALINGRPEPPARKANQTDFASLTASANIQNGVVDNPDLALDAPLMRVRGNGKADLPQQRLDYRLTVNLVESLKGQGGDDLSELKELPIPLHISGPFSEPKIKVELAKILREKAKEELERQKKKAQEKLEQKVEEKKQELEQKADKRKEELQQELEQKAKDKLKDLIKF